MAKQNLNKFGFYVSVATVFMTVVTFLIAVLTPPLSGPYCKGSCYTYPYLDIASRFPRDYYWMYLAMILMIVYIMLMVFIHRWASEDKKVYSQTGLSFSLISATVLLIAYFVQVTVIQPSLLRGETDGIAMLSQYNPHGVFIALEELGYFLMGIAFLFMAPVFSKGTLEKSIRWTFIISAALTIFSFIAYSLVYGISREYRFEVAGITSNWFTLIISGILLACLYKRSGNSRVK